MTLARVELVIGTRPEAIKLAPVAAALAGRGLAVSLAVTGQHSTLSPAAFGLGALPALRLRCPAARDPHAHAAAVAAALATHWRGADRPAMVLVQGDTSSALGGALAAEACGVPLGHVEAGLRSHDLALPWPEEGNRVAIDARANLLFAPTEANAANLRAEAVGGEIHVTGNSAIDALFAVLEDLPPRAPRPRAVPRLLVTCHRRENWGPAFEPIAAALRRLATLPWLRIDLVLHPNPAMASAAELTLSGHPRIRLHPPLEHRALVALMRDAALVLSDSGGVQEEAPALGVPLLVLRSRTERPEGIASGNSRLVGNDRDLILAEVERLLSDRPAWAAMAVPSLPFGDGRAGPRIAGAVADWLARRGQTHAIVHA